MQKTLLTTCAILGLSVAPALAQSMTAASVSGTFTSYTEDTFDEDYTSFSGGVEFSISPQFAVAGSAGIYNGVSNEFEGTNLTAHGIYMLSPATGIGGFVTAESDGIDDFTLYGVEFGSASTAIKTDGYFGVVEGDSLTLDTSVFGLSFEFALSPQFDLGLNYDSFSVSEGTADLTFNDTAVVARYNIDDRFSVFAELGQLSLTLDDDGSIFVSEDPTEYFGIGAKFAIGRPGGTLMDERTYIGLGT